MSIWNRSLLSPKRRSRDTWKRSLVSYLALVLVLVLTPSSLGILAYCLTLAAIVTFQVLVYFAPLFGDRLWFTDQELGFERFFFKRTKFKLTDVDAIELWPAATRKPPSLVVGNDRLEMPIRPVEVEEIVFELTRVRPQIQVVYL